MGGKCGSNGEHVDMCYQGGEVMKYSAPPVVSSRVHLNAAIAITTGGALYFSTSPPR